MLSHHDFRFPPKYFIHQIKLLFSSYRPYNNVIRATNLGGKATRVVQVKITKIVAE